MDGTSEILTWVVTISMIFVMLFATYILVNQYIGFSLGMGTIDRYCSLQHTIMLCVTFVR